VPEPKPPHTPREATGDISDSQLVARSLGGDDRAWRELVDRYKRLVYSIPRRYRLPDDQCDDVFQNVFASLLRHLSKVRDAESLPKWMITTTCRECWRQVRENKAAQGRTEPGWPVDASDPSDPPEARAEAWERQFLVDQALRSLGGRCERLLRAIFLDPSKPSYTAISERLGMPVGSIGPVRARCLAKLLELLPDLD